MNWCVSKTSPILQKSLHRFQFSNDLFHLSSCHPMFNKLHAMLLTHAIKKQVNRGTCMIISLEMLITLI